MFQSLGLLTYFIYSNGMVPKTSKDVKIFENAYQGMNLELVQMLQSMLHHDPVQRPTISEINK